MATSILAGSAAPASCEVFHSKESALRLAFPDADSVVTRSLLLSEKQAQRVRTLARTQLESRLARLYTGWRGGAVIGYAFIETHQVRSLPETILLVLDPAGNSQAVHLLAFHEPVEYQPSDRWLTQFRERRLDDELALRRGIAGIAGSTLSATAITGAVRRLLAIHEVCVAPRAPDSSTMTEAVGGEEPLSTTARDQR